MKKLFPVFALLFLTHWSEGQQLHFTSQYLRHNAMLNPGAAGISDKNMIGISYRNMWSSFPGNPRTFMVYADVNLDKMQSGMAAYLYRDQTGPTTRTGFQFGYSRHLTAKDSKNKIGIGIELRGLQYAIDKTKLATALEDDPVLAGAASKFGFDAGAGIYFTNDKLSVGAAVSQLIQSKLKLADVPGATSGGKLYRHYNFTANYKINAGDGINLIPNTMIRVIENSPSEVDLGMQANYQDKIWWGANWRVKQSWSLQAGFKLFNQIALNYSYDIYQTPLSVFSAGSGAHEVALQFQFNKRK